MEIRFCVAPYRLEAAHLRAILTKLAYTGWRPALLAADQALARCARPDAPAAPRRPTAGCGDLVFRGDDLFYVVSKPAGRQVWIEPSGVASEPDLRPEVELGVIAFRAGAARARLAEFASEFQRAAQRALADGAAEADSAAEVMARPDPANAGFGEFPWRPQPAAPRLEAWRHARDGDRLCFEPPLLRLTDLDRGHCLAEDDIRARWMDLLRAGGVAEADWLADDAGGNARRALERLRSAGLAESEYLVCCAASGRPLLRLAALQSDSELRAAADLGDRACPDCGAPLSREKLARLVVPPADPLATQPARWLRVWMTETLNQLGVPALLWGRRSGPTAEIVAEFYGESWCFVVSAERIERAEALALIRRQGEYGWRRMVILALGGVGREGRLLLDQPLPDSRAARPLTLETASAAPAALEREFAGAALGYARRRLRPLEEACGYPLARVLASLYGLQRPVPPPSARAGFA